MNSGAKRQFWFSMQPAVSLFGDTRDVSETRFLWFFMSPNSYQIPSRRAHPPLPSQTASTDSDLNAAIAACAALKESEAASKSTSAGMVSDHEVSLKASAPAELVETKSAPVVCLAKGGEA